MEAKSGNLTFDLMFVSRTSFSLILTLQTDYTATGLELSFNLATQ
jgi:hypothetical protein